jgi:hypothetical protein
MHCFYGCSTSKLEWRKGEIWLGSWRMWQKIWLNFEA